MQVCVSSEWRAGMRSALTGWPVILAAAAAAPATPPAPAAPPALGPLLLLAAAAAFCRLLSLRAVWPCLRHALPR